jgi:hypothetical protein
MKMEDGPTMKSFKGKETYGVLDTLLCKLVGTYAGAEQGDTQFHARVIADRYNRRWVEDQLLLDAEVSYPTRYVVVLRETTVTVLAIIPPVIDHTYSVGRCHGTAQGHVYLENPFATSVDTTDEKTYYEDFPK